jgi:hypothetical protein
VRSSWRAVWLTSVLVFGLTVLGFLVYSCLRILEWLKTVDTGTLK